VTPSNKLFWYPAHICNHLVRPSIRPFVRPFVCPSVHTFVTDISASTGRNDFIFDIWLWHGDLYRVSPFQVYHTSTSCLQCNLEFFMFAVMKTFVFLFTVRLTNERVGVFLARRSMQHLVMFLQ
jgi:hypothetical protein